MKSLSREAIVEAWMNPNCNLSIGLRRHSLGLNRYDLGLLNEGSPYPTKVEGLMRIDNQKHSPQEEELHHHAEELPH